MIERDEEFAVPQLRILVQVGRSQHRIARHADGLQPLRQFERVLVDAPRGEFCFELFAAGDSRYRACAARTAAAEKGTSRASASHCAAVTTPIAM